VLTDQLHDGWFAGLARLYSALVVSSCHKRVSASNDSNDSNGRPRQAAMAAATRRLRAGYAQATRRLRGY
jgi:hypothetical protein